jgi:hypothetical protein
VAALFQRRRRGFSPVSRRAIHSAGTPTRRKTSPRVVEVVEPGPRFTITSSSFEQDLQSIGFNVEQATEVLEGARKTVGALTGHSEI